MSSAISVRLCRTLARIDREGEREGVLNLGGLTLRGPRNIPGNIHNSCSVLYSHTMLYTNDSLCALF